MNIFLNFLTKLCLPRFPPSFGPLNFPDKAMSKALLTAAVSQLDLGIWEGNLEKKYLFGYFPVRGFVFTKG